jgi:hypothetical protein
MRSTLGRDIALLAANCLVSPLPNAGKLLRTINAQLPDVGRQTPLFRLSYGLFGNVESMPAWCRDTKGEEGVKHD